jgi:glycosyltransferase involved in cell wall biosynthesis
MINRFTYNKLNKLWGDDPSSLTTTNLMDSKDKKILILSTSAVGGMLSVIEGYRRDGVFDHWNIQFIPTHAIGSLSKKLWAFIKSFSHVFRLIVKGRIALMHCHVSMRGSVWRKSILATLGRSFGIPIILHLHGSETKQFYNSLPTFAQRLMSQQLTLATVVFVLSESWRSFVLEIAPKAHVIVLPNYVELPKLTTRPKNSSKINVLFLGLVGDRKGTYDLLEAFAAAIKNVPELFLRIGGNGEIEKAEALIHQLGLEANVECLGWISGNAKTELLRDADIFVLPSYNEGLPVSLLEAMSWGIPVITTTVGGIPELIEDHVNGFLIAPGNISALQNLLEQLGRDPALCHLSGMAGRESIQKQYSKEVILPRLTSVYAEYVSGNK